MLETTGEQKKKKKKKNPGRAMTAGNKRKIHCRRTLQNDVPHKVACL